MNDTVAKLKKAGLVVVFGAGLITILGSSEVDRSLLATGAEDQRLRELPDPEAPGLTVMAIQAPLWVFAAPGGRVLVEVAATTTNTAGRDLPVGAEYEVVVSRDQDPSNLSRDFTAGFRFDYGVRTPTSPLASELTIDVSADSKPGIYHHKVQVTPQTSVDTIQEYEWHEAELRVVVVPVGGPVSMSRVVKVAAGAQHSLALLADGAVWAWGDNAFGQLGDGTRIDRNAPVRVEGLPLVVTDIAAGDSHSLALGPDGSVYSWGAYDSGQLGLTAFVEPSEGLIAERCTDVPWQQRHRDASDSTVARRIWFVAETSIGGLSGECEQLAIPFTGASRIAAGARHSIALMTDGSVWTWGGDERGQLGNRLDREARTLESEWDFSAPRSNVPDRPYPVPLPLPVTAVSAGGQFSLAVLLDGTVMGWGRTDNGQLTRINTTADRAAPIEVPFLRGVDRVSAGPDFALALIGSEPGFRAWGTNQSGQLGLGHDDPVVSAPPRAATNLFIRSLAAGDDHALAAAADGTVYAWGANGFDQLGGAAPGLQANSPVQVPGVPGIDQVAAGKYHSLARDAVCGTVIGWGANADGQLGSGAVTQKRPTPLPVYGLGALSADRGCTVSLTVYQPDHGSVDLTPFSFDAPACRGACSIALDVNSQVALSATADPGYTFAGWGGDCTGAALTIQLLMDRSLNCFADYRRSPGAADPIAAFDYTPASPETGQLITFDASDSSDDGAIVSFLWDFDNDGNFDGSGIVATTSFAVAGDHPVRLRVEDDSGARDQLIRQVQVVSPTAPQSFSLTVSITGDGRVTDATGGIDCGIDCSEDYPAGTVVDLSASPAIGSRFNGWGDDCSSAGSQPALLLSMESGKRCTAGFSPLSVNTARLTVVPIGFGRGAVSSDVPGIACEFNAQSSVPDPCAFDFPLDAVVVLTVTPDVSSGFIGWGDVDCRTVNTNGTECTLTMDQDRFAEVNLD